MVGLVYGVSGTGKTTFAASCPKPVLLIDIKEQGTASIIGKDVDVIELNDWDKLAKLVAAIDRNPMFRKYKTIIIDTITNAQEARIAKVTGSNTKSAWGIPQREWGRIAGDLKTLFFDLAELEGKNILFLAHVRTFGGDEEGEEEDISPERNARLMPSAVSTLNAICEFIGNTFIRVEIGKVKVRQGNKVITKKRRLYKYCMRIGPNPVYVTKIRKPTDLVIPEWIEDPTWEKVCSYMEKK